MSASVVWSIALEATDAAMTAARWCGEKGGDEEGAESSADPVLAGQPATLEGESGVGAMKDRA